MNEPTNRAETIPVSEVLIRLWLLPQSHRHGRPEVPATSSGVGSWNSGHSPGKVSGEGKQERVWSAKCVIIG